MITAATGLRLEVIGDLESLSALKHEWTTLVEVSAASTPFHTPEWLLTWWKHFGSGELRVFACRQGCALLGILPCFLHTWEGRRQLTLLGSGISDYLEPLMAPGSAPELFDLLSGYLLGASNWDVCDWQDLASPTPLAGLAQTGLCVRIADEIPCSEISIAGTWDDFCRDRPHGLRRNLRRYAEKARQVADFHFFAEQGFKAELLEILIRLHRARWTRHGEAGMIAANRSANFLREAVPALAARGKAMFFGLEFQGRTVAVILSFPHNNVLFAYLSGFDPEYDQYGFGRLLLNKSLEYAFQKRFKSWNFLRGNEPYKFEWGSRIIPKCRLIISRQGA